MKKLYLLLYLLALLQPAGGEILFAAPGTPPDVLWEKTFGKERNDQIRGLCETSHGDYLMAGWTSTLQTVQLYLLKVDASGDLVWERTFGVEGAQQAFSVLETGGGDCLVAGSLWTVNRGKYDGYLIRCDEGGTKIWDKTYTGVNNKIFQSAREIQVMENGGFLITGKEYSVDGSMLRLLLIRTDLSGNVLWERTFAGSGRSVGSSVLETSDGECLALGSTTSSVDEKDDVYLIRCDAGGNRIWEKTYGGNLLDAGASVQEVTGGGFIIAGSTETLDEKGYLIYVLRTDAGGEIIWEKTFGSRSSQIGSSIGEAPDGSFVVAGWSDAVAARDCYLLKCDSGGRLLWERTVGGNKIDRAYSALALSDGSYVLAGETESFGAGALDGYLVKLEPEPPPLQVPGDCNQDGILDLTDGICLLWGFFVNNPVELPCGDGSFQDPHNISLLDSNGDGKLDLSDILYVFGYLFRGDPPPVLGPDCVAIPGCPVVCGQ